MEVTSMDKNLRRKIKELEEQMEALIIAIPKEEASYHFYTDLAKNTEHEGSRKMFNHLADEELAHKSSLIELVERLRKEIASLKK
jgi:rubrerythrin